MKKPIFSVTVFLFILSFTFSSCKKDKGSSCFNEALYLKYKDGICTADCPGVTGCDGKHYCNECDANRQGIEVR